MTALENVTQDEFNHLKVGRHELFVDVMKALLSKGIYGFSHSFYQYDLRYDPTTRRVSLYKARIGRATDGEMKDLNLIRSPSEPEEEILTVAYRYIELYRATKQYKPAKKHRR